MVTPCFSAHFNSFSLMYSGALSTLMVPGLPRHSMILSKLRMTRSAGNEKSTSMPSPSRLKSSSTFSSRNARPSPRRSAMKSIDQVRLGASGTANASGLSRLNRLRGVRHCHSDQWRSMAHSAGSVPVRSKSGKLFCGSINGLGHCEGVENIAQIPKFFWLPSIRPAGRLSLHSPRATSGCSDNRFR